MFTNKRKNTPVFKEIIHFSIQFSTVMNIFIVKKHNLILFLQMI